ncbi:uncharacterized protein LOC126738814 [Anthonomus grandis grandis]|uniref:uncharacterized protein LOC126738814 n=1 Tax=Anthonomus grandis grandis TaxID=2921223 RepID=UPI002165B67D|nr:uncharacterized protein LOC126738814 [Anthonomus grandis grandis]
MAAYIHHVAVTLILLLTWFFISSARIVSDISDNDPDKEMPLEIKERTRIFPDELKFSDYTFSRPYRAIRRIMKPRATRIGENLFTARGYGKRAGKNDMELLSARTYGKRNEDQLSSYLCAITKCHEPYQTSPNINENMMARMMERRDTELPNELEMDED